MKKISNSEFVVMRVLWDTGEALNRHQITEIVHKDPYNQTWELATVSTFISRLYHKGLISYNKENKIYCYYPKVTKLEYVRTMIDQKLLEVFDKDICQLVLHYTNNEINDTNIADVKMHLDNYTKA